MKNIICVVILLMSFNVSAQNLEEILEKHFEAIGSKKLSEASSMEMNTIMTMQGISMNQTLSFKRPSKVRSEMKMMGQDVVMIYDGKKAYMKLGATGYTPMPDGQSNDLIRMSDIDGPLYNWEEKGHKVSYKGTEEIDGNKFYRIEIVQKGMENTPAVWLLDAETYLLKYQRVKMNQMGVAIDAETEMLEYKEFGGIKMPVKIVSKSDGTEMLSMEFTDVKFNTEIDDALFNVE